MKYIKSSIVWLLFLSICLTSNFNVWAHTCILNIEYDPCNYSPKEDDLDETWYVLPGLFYQAQNANESDIYAEYHLSEEVTTIKYYFENKAKHDSEYTWITDIYKEYIKTMSDEEALEKANAEAEEIKVAYANSMKKWNNVYYYSYDENGYRHANKIINVVEGTKEDHDITIYPIDYYKKDGNPENEDSITYVACVSPIGEAVELNESYDGVQHKHYSKWEMHVNVNYFYAHDAMSGDTSDYDVGNMSEDSSELCREITGQHELGHVFGLGDVDELCTASAQTDHHEEILMGYGRGNRSTYAKYKDIAGVSITRGFHTDSDHIWMLRRNTDGTNDVICSLCNGVRYNVSLSADGTYENQVLNMYRSCTHHNGTNHDMLLVATDGTRDFYKCQYCRYIFELKIDSEETVSMSSGGNSGGELKYGSQKIYKLNVLHEEIYDITVSSTKKFTFELYDADLKLIYSLSEGTYNNFDIDLTEGIYYIRVYNSNVQTVNFNLSIQPPPHTHSYTEWAKYTKTHHIECCECGLTGSVTEPHAVVATDLLFANCIHCGEFVNLKDTIVMVPPASANKVTLNGSYILPNGIIVLDEEDVEAYLNGTLVWYDKDNLPVTQ